MHACELTSKFSVSAPRTGNSADSFNQLPAQANLHGCMGAQITHYVEIDPKACSKLECGATSTMGA